LKIMAPLLAVTADEAWEHVKLGKKSESIHLEDWPEDNYDKWHDAKLDEKWALLAALREAVLKKLEEKRQAEEIGSGLEARVILSTGDAKYNELLKEKKDDLRYILIVSQVELGEGVKDVEGPLPVAIRVEKARGEKCQRCWNYSEAVGKDDPHPTLCERCVKAVY
jgi:isoleucyl-tRNA synthetase